MKKEVRYIGNYKVLDIIGKGGMAKVYTAIHIPLNRIVVIKEMGRNESRRRFKQEALIGASLEHKNIVSVYDYFSVGNACYLVMQYIDGLSLAEIIEAEAPLAPQIAALIAREICLAIEHAHNNNIIHRDIKPTNILISRQGELKITDFGVARGEDMPHLTSTGTVIGTPFYMSPEQAAGKKLTTQSDIYSIGIVLYEIVTGKKPYTGESTHEITAQIIRGKYSSPFWHDPHHSLRLTRIIRKAMAKSLKKRYQSVSQMSKDLVRFAGWKKTAQIQEMLEHLVKTVELNKNATTIVRHSKQKKKRKKKRKSRRTFYITLLLILTLAFLIYYLITLFVT